MMKKLLTIITLAVVLTACDNGTAEKTTETKKDSTVVSMADEAKAISDSAESKLEAFKDTAAKNLKVMKDSAASTLNVIRDTATSKLKKAGNKIKDAGNKMMDKVKEEIKQ